MTVTSQVVRTNGSRHKINLARFDFVAALGILLVLAIIWFPFGLKVMGLVEEWDLMAQLDSHANLIPYIHQVFTIRPLLIMPFAAGYVLTPGSYVGLSFFQLLLFFVKGVLVYSLLRRLFPTKPAFAFLTSILFIIYPADTELFAMRNLANHFALCCYLASIYLLVIYWQRPRRITLCLSLLALACSLLTYEAGYALVAFSPLILLWLEGRFTKKVLRLTGLWYSIPLVCAVWSVVQLKEVQNSQQARLLSGNATIALSDNVRAIADSLLRAYTRNFFASWNDIATRIPNPSYFIEGLIIATVVGLIAWYLTGPSIAKFEKKTRREFFTLVLAGLIMFGLGFAPYLLSPYHRNINGRVFYFASLGAALVVARVVWQISQMVIRSRLLFTLMTSVLVAFCALNAFSEKQQLSDYSQIQQRLLAGIAEQMPDMRSDVLILIFDPSWTFRSTFWTFGGASVRLQHSLNYLYGSTNIHAAFCYPNAPISVVYTETCSFTSDKLVLLNNGEIQESFSYDKVLALNFDGWTQTLSLLTVIPREYVSPPREINTYNLPPGGSGTSAPPRTYSLFTRWSDNVPVQHTAQHSVIETFEQPIVDTGWGEPEAAGMWMANKEAALSYVLIPDTAYSVSFKAVALAPDMIENLTLQVNDVPISLTEHPDGYFFVFQGKIPQAAVARNPVRTRLIFNTSRAVTPKSLGINDDQRVLALFFQWLKIEPVSASPTP